MQINQKFKNLIPPLSADEREKLKESIEVEGVRDALIVWGDILVDGHNRYEICQELDVPYQTRQIEFADEEEAEAWILRNQLARRNLSDVERARIALKLKDMIAAKAKERQIAQLKQNSTVPQNFGERQGNTVLQNFAKREEQQLLANLPKAVEQHPINTRAELAKIAGVSQETLRKVERVDKIAPEPIRAAMDDKIISIDKAYKLATELQKTPEEQRREKAEEILALSLRKKEEELARRQKIATKIENMIYGVSCHTSLITQENVDIMLEESERSCNDWFESIDLAIGALNEIKGYIQNRNCIRRVK